MKAIKHSLHILIISLLTILTQVGGIIWILNFGYYKLRKSPKSKFFKGATFTLLYLTATLLIVPLLAKTNNRVPLPILKDKNLAPHNFITPLLNRHYVKPQLKSELETISKELNSKNNDIHVSYLDANFPFIDGFPLLPHLSHNDGRKIDLTFFYTFKGKEGNLKPSNSGYGKFVEPNLNEINQTNVCKSKGYWQYDYTKYLTLGSRDDLKFDLQTTKELVALILNASSTQKLLIEPHIKHRINISNDKIRFHGCHAVRHDDHIHYQIN